MRLRQLLVSSLVLLANLASSAYGQGKPQAVDRGAGSLAVRLAGGDGPTTGRVEVFYNGSWGTICDDDWNIEGANVVCRMLGYDGALEYIHSGKFGPGEGEILMDNVQCSGGERNISECQFNGWGVHDCSHHEDAGLKCNKRRLPGYELLDRGPLSEFVQLRLRPGRGSKRRTPQYQGYLEAAYRKKWHRVCSDNWDERTARVVCGQLGFPDALRVEHEFDGDSGEKKKRKRRHLMADLICDGTESELKQCHHEIASAGKMRGCASGQPLFVTCTHRSRKSWRKHVKKSDLRLRAGSRAGEGRLEIKMSGLWGSVCHRGFDLQAASVACRQLGFGSAKRAVIDSFFGQAQGVVWISDIKCKGNESKLTNCWHELRASDEDPSAPVCSHSEEAGVACHVPRTHHDKRVRLVGGRNPMEGRVEVKVHKHWGPVCSAGWTIKEALVVCRQLGLGFALHALKDVYFYVGSPNITSPVMESVKCNGDEAALQHCAHSVAVDGCSAPSRSLAPFAGVICTEMSPDLVLDVPLLQNSLHLDQQALHNLQCAAEEMCLAPSAYKPENSYSSRRLLRFSTRVWNRGRADFRPKRMQSEWIWHQCHGHYHSMAEFTHYDILADNGTKMAEGHKASFCLEDSECDPGVSKRFDCDQPGGGTQGIAVGCADNYQYNIDCQWIDITDVPSGNYRFRVRVNPHALVAESDLGNNEANCHLRYDGFRVWAWGCNLSDQYDV